MSPSPVLINQDMLIRSRRPQHQVLVQALRETRLRLKLQGSSSKANPSGVEASEESSSSKHPIVLKKNQRVRQSLEERRDQGHFPFHVLQPRP